MSAQSEHSPVATGEREPVPGAGMPAHGRARGRAVALAVVVALAVAAVAGIVGVSRQVGRGASAAAGGPGAASAELRISHDFGAAAVKRVDGAVTAGKTTAMSLLSAHARVVTGYGGGFVNSIDGQASGFAGGTRADWFFYVDGLQATSGAAETPVAAGTRIWWDFHRWDFAPSVPAVVGQFPAPFVVTGRAAAPTLVAYAAGASAQADRIARALRAAGAAHVTVQPMAATSALPAQGNVVLVGMWDALARLPFVAQGAQHPERSGLFARFDAGRLVTLDALGGATTHPQGAGAVLATSSSDRAGAAVWLVTGAEPSDVDAAVSCLADGARSLQGRFGVAVSRAGGVVALPTAAASQ